MTICWNKVWIQCFVNGFVLFIIAVLVKFLLALYRRSPTTIYSTTPLQQQLGWVRFNQVGLAKWLTRTSKPAWITLSKCQLMYVSLDCLPTWSKTRSLAARITRPRPWRYVRLLHVIVSIMGNTYKTSAQFSDFWTPPPLPCTEFTQPCSFSLLFGDPLPPPTADVI